MAVLLIILLHIHLISFGWNLYFMVTFPSSAGSSDSSLSVSVLLDLWMFSVSWRGRYS